MQQTNTRSFKVGDKVKVKPYSEFDFTDELYDCCQRDVKQISEMSFTVLEIDTDGDLCLDTDAVIDYNFSIHPNEVIPVSTKNPRKHAELIKQWVEDDSLEIEVSSGADWFVTKNPEWHEEQQYRIKPKKVTKWKWAYRNRQGYPEISLVWLTEEEIKSYPGVNPYTLTKLDWTAKEFEI